MDFDLLLNELLHTIISYLDIKSAKQLSLTSTRIYSLALSRIWSKPRYSKLKDINFLQKISKFPISELHTGDFDCSWLEIHYMIPQLKLLHVDLPRNKYDQTELCMNSRLRFLNLPTIVHTHAFQIAEQEHFEQLLDIVETINVKEMVIDGFKDRWSCEQLQMFVGKVHISEI